MSQEPSAPPSCRIMGYEISADPDGIRIEVTDYQAGIAFIPWGEVEGLRQRSATGCARLEESIVPPEPESTLPPLTSSEQEIGSEGEGRGDVEGS